MNAYEVEVLVLKVLIELGYDQMEGEFRPTKLADDLGMDSLDVINFLCEIEVEFDIRNKSFTDAYTKVVTIGDVCDLVGKEMGVE